MTIIRNAFPKAGSIVRGIPRIAAGTAAFGIRGRTFRDAEFSTLIDLIGSSDRNSR